MTEKYRPPVGSGSNDIEPKTKEYSPPVGPGSKSLPPTGSFRELPMGLLPEITIVKD